MPSQPSSWIWAHDAPDKPTHRQFHLDKDGREAWKCRYCLEKKWPLSVTYARSGGTGGPTRHLHTKHRITKDVLEAEYDDSGAKSTQQSSTEPNSSRPGSIAMVFQQQNETQRPRKRVRITKLEEVDPAYLKELFQNFIIANSLSFRLCESASFRAFLVGINPCVDELLPTSHGTISAGLLDRYEVEKGKIRALLGSALSRIHLSCDNWTCDNAGKAYMGITARFANNHGRHQLVLAIKELLGSHSGENMAEIFLQVAQDFEIHDKIGFCNADNASPNDKMADHIEETLYECGLRWKAKLNRLRCVGHISNLAVQALLFGKHPNKDLDPDLPSVEDMANWRKASSLGILHDLIVWIYGSPQRRKAFLILSEGRNLIRDNNTRWTSWFDAISRVLELQGAIELQQLAISRDRKIKPADRPAFLESDDWDTLRLYKDFLEPYKEATLATEGYQDGLNCVLMAMDMLLGHLEEGKVKYAGNAHFIASIETSWNVMEKYYRLTDESPAYVAAVVMDPRWKWAYFEIFWATDALKPYIKTAKQQVRLFSAL
jgi:hypothetical protein